MSNIRVLSDVELSGALSFNTNHSDFPSNPQPRTIAVKEGIPYIYTELVNNSGFFTWQPMGIGTKQTSYLHTQGIASTAWTINHNLVIANIEIVDTNTCRIKLVSAITGTAVLFSLQYVNTVTAEVTNTLNLGGTNLTTSNGVLNVSGNPVAFKSYVDAQDSALSTRIDNIAANIDPAAIDSISELLTAFQAADGDLSSALTGLSSSTSSLITAETTRATAAESALQSTIDTSLLTKVDKVAGKGLSTEDYTTAEKSKLASINTGAYLTGNQSISVTGDATGSGTTSIALTLATITNSGTGTFKKVTVDTKGRVTGTAAVAQADITGLLGAGSITNTMLANSAVANLSGTNTGDQTITLTGDATGTGTGSFAVTLSNSGVTAGTYKSVTVDAKGRVTAGTNPTTLSGYGITDAYTKAQVDAAITTGSSNISFSVITGKPTTIAGYGITDGVDLTTAQTLTNKTLTNPTITNYTETLNAPAAGSAFTIDLSTGTIQKLTTNGNTTITLPTSVAGKSYIVVVAYGGAHTITWAGGSTIKWAGGTAPTATSTNGKIDIFTFMCDGTNTYGQTGGANY